MRPFIITASNMSAIANHHKYKDWKIALADTLGRYKQIKGGYQSVNEIIDKTNEIPLGLSPKASHDAQSYAASASLRHQGTMAESKIINDLKEYSDLKDIDTTDVLLKYTMIIHDCPVTIFGRTDGRTTNGVIEVKNRKNCFFEPIYDLDQLAVYVALTDSKEGILVQNHEDTIKINRYNRKDMMNRWDLLLKDLEPAITRFKIICENPECDESKEILDLMVQ
jgi:hypothetical protein